MEVIDSAVIIQLSKEEKDKISEAHKIISDLYDTMRGYGRDCLVSNDGNGFSEDQLWDAYNLTTALVTSDKLRLEN